MRHLQPILYALPSGSQVPRTDVNSQSIPVVSDKVQRSNIVSVSRILTKSPNSTLQSTLHALFLPTPFKYVSFAPDDPQKRAPEEVLKPGALYAECAVAPIRIPVTLALPEEEKTDGGGDGNTQGGAKRQVQVQERLGEKRHRQSEQLPSFSSLTLQYLDSINTVAACQWTDCICNRRHCVGAPFGFEVIFSLLSLVFTN